MHKMRQDDGISPTRGIYWILKPYWKDGILDDQHWAYVIACLHLIEVRCVECKEDMIIKAL